jgi:hypothetical protein
MRFKAKKVYGQSKVITCPFCSRQATQKNEQGLDVCRSHTKSNLEEIKCTCGKWLEQRVGKFGPYFNCINCGNFNYNKAMEIKSMTMKNYVKKEPEPSVTSEKPSYFKKEKTFSEKPNSAKKRKEITITTDDIEYFS